MRKRTISGPVQSYQIRVSCSTLAELQSLDPGVDGAQTFFRDDYQPWFWFTTLPPGVTTSLDGSTGAVTARPGGFWVSLYALINITAALGPYNTIAEGAAGSGRLIDQTVAEITRLRSLPALGAGVQVWTESVRNPWYWEPSFAAGEATDNAETCRPLAWVATGLPGAWVRLTSPNPSWMLGPTPTLFVDETNGRTEYDGSNATHVGTGLVGPTTYREAIRRLAEKGLIRVPAGKRLSVKQVGDANSTWFDIAVDADAEGIFVLEAASMTQQFEGTLSAGQAFVTPTTINNGTSTWTVATEKNRLVYDVTQDAYGWIDQDLGGGIAQMSQLVTLGVDTGVIASKNPTLGDTVRTFTQPKLGGFSLFIRRATNDPGNGTPARGLVIVQNLNFTGAAGRVIATSAYQLGLFRNCDFGPSSARFNGGAFTLSNCQFLDSSGLIGAQGVGAQVGVQAGHFYGTGVFGANAGARFGLSSNPLFRGPLTLFENNFCSCTSAVFYLVNNPILVQRNSTLFVGFSLWGVALTGVGVTFRKGTKMIWSVAAQPNIALSPAGGDFTLGGNASGPVFDITAPNAYTAANVAYSWANLFAAAPAGFGARLVDPVTGCQLISDV